LGPLVEILKESLQVDPKRRPSAGQLLNKLSDFIEENLQIDINELRGPYFPSAPFIGRSDILKTISHHLDELFLGVSTAILLEGIGKSL